MNNTAASIFTAAPSHSAKRLLGRGYSTETNGMHRSQAPQWSDNRTHSLSVSHDLRWWCGRQMLWTGDCQASAGRELPRFSDSPLWKREAADQAKAGRAEHRKFQVKNCRTTHRISATIPITNAEIKWRRSSAFIGQNLMPDAKET